MKRRTTWTVNGFGILGVVAVTGMIVTGRAPDAVRLVDALVPPGPTPTFGPCRDATGQVVPGVALTGCSDHGAVVPVPTWAQHFQLVVRYPGGYEATAEGAVLFMTEIPTPLPPTITPTRTRTSLPTPTWTPYKGATAYCTRHSNLGGITFVECYICDPFTAAQLGPVVYCSSVPCGQAPCLLGMTPVVSRTPTPIPTASSTVPCTPCVPSDRVPGIVPFRAPIPTRTPTP